MIQLDYQTYNNAHGLCGMKYSSWLSYSYILGFLSNPAHNKYCNNINNNSNWNNSISIHVERNDVNGAWGKEGRLHYYLDTNSLETYFNDLFQHKSAGNNSVSCRINSNECWKSLFIDYHFQITYRGNNMTADIIPPLNSYQTVKTILLNHLRTQSLSPNELLFCSLLFDDGYNM